MKNDLLTLTKSKMLPENTFDINDHSQHKNREITRTQKMKKHVSLKATHYTFCSTQSLKQTYFVHYLCMYCILVSTVVV